MLPKPGVTLIRPLQEANGCRSPVVQVALSLSKERVASFDALLDTGCPYDLVVSEGVAVALGVEGHELFDHGDLPRVFGAPESVEAFNAFLEIEGEPGDEVFSLQGVTAVVSGNPLADLDVLIGQGVLCSLTFWQTASTRRPGDMGVGWNPIV